MHHGHETPLSIELDPANVPGLDSLDEPDDLESWVIGRLSAKPLTFSATFQADDDLIEHLAPPELLTVVFRARRWFARWLPKNWTLPRWCQYELYRGCCKIEGESFPDEENVLRFRFVEDGSP